jgi:hypothetical protein
VGKLQVIHYLCKNEIEQFRRESNDGEDVSSLFFWEQKISNELELYKIRQIPDFETKSFGYGAHFGLGVGFFTGSIGEYFNPSFNLIFGFDFAYKKSILYLNATLTGGKVRKDYLSDKNWYKKQNVTLAILDISYGYAFLDNRKIKLTPFAGFGIIELSGQNKDNEEDRLRFVNYNILFGINADYKLRTKIKFVQNFGIKEKVETSIRARLYVSRANFAPNMKGFSINFTVGICGFGNMIRVN